MAFRIEHTRDGYELAFGERSNVDLRVTLSASEYEDLYYPLPLNATAYYRLLTDQVFADRERRAVFLSMLTRCPSQSEGIAQLQACVGACAPKKGP